MSTRLSLLLLGTSLLTFQTMAFSIAPAMSGMPSTRAVAAQRGIPLFMTESADDESPAPETTTEDAVEDVADEPQEEEEDPELKALKDEIAQLEQTLKDKRRTLAGTRDKADEYTKTGYARKVAEMENMRRARSVSMAVHRMLVGLWLYCGLSSRFETRIHHWIKPILSPCLLPQILSFLALVDVNAFCNLLTLCHNTTTFSFP